MTNEILKAISHLAELADGTVQFDDAAQAYWEDTNNADNLDAVKEAHDNINNRFILLQDAMGRILREYGQRSGEFGRVLQADEQFNANK